MLGVFWDWLIFHLKESMGWLGQQFQVEIMFTSIDLSMILESSPKQSRVVSDKRRVLHLVL